MSEQTRRETEAAIERLGYRSHAIARNLRQRSSRLIGYRVPPAQRGALHPVLDGFLHALTTAARAAGYSVLLFVPDEDADEATVHEEMLRTSTVDGLVLTDTTRRDPRIEFLASRELPFVCFGRTDLDIPHSWVDVDGAVGTAAAVHHLAGRGHRRIAYLGVDSEFRFETERRRGYADAVAAAGSRPRPGARRPGRRRHRGRRGDPQAARPRSAADGGGREHRRARARGDPRSAVRRGHGRQGRVRGSRASTTHRWRR